MNYKNNTNDELNESLDISKDSQNKMPQILESFFADMSHIMASAQTFFANAMLGSSVSQSVGDGVHTFIVGADFLRQISRRIDTFHNVVKYGTAVLPMIKEDSFFNPGDLNQEVGDMLSVYSASRNISIVLENPYQNLGGDLYLAFYDLDFLRQILLQFISAMIALADQGSYLKLRLSVTDIESETLLTPEMGHYLSAAIRSRMKMIFQIKYHGITKTDLPEPLDKYYSTVFRSKDGSFVSYTCDSACIEEIHVPCYAIHFDNVVKTIGYYEIPGQMPYTLDERMLFTSSIRFFKVVLVGSKESMILNQLKKYLYFWGADISSIISAEKTDIINELSDIARNCAQENEDIHKHHAIIIDDDENFLCIIDHTINQAYFTCAIVVTSLMKYKEVSSKLFCFCNENEMERERSYVALTSSTCGPERLLAILRQFDDQFIVSISRPIVTRMVYETPPFGAIHTTRKQEYEGKAVKDLSSNIRVLVVDDDLTNRTIVSNFFRQKHIKHDLVSDGKAAVTNYKEKRHDIILMDLIMPEMDGIEAIIKIRNFEKSQPGSFQTVIIAMTACLLDVEYDKAIKAGCNDFLIKPLSLRWLMQKIKDWGNLQASLRFEDDDIQ